MTEAGGLGWYRSWRVMAIDGVVLDAPDSPGNVAAFGKWRNAIAASPFPQVRVVGLAECGSRAIVAARIEPCHTDEKSIARDLIGDLDADMLLLADRGFYGYDMWKQFRRFRRGTVMAGTAQNHAADPPTAARRVVSVVAGAEIDGGATSPAARGAGSTATNAIRHLMHEAADDAEVDLDRVSFMRSLRVIRRQVTDQAAFSPSPIDELDPDGLD
jgi:hypothetical protein